MTPSDIDRVYTAVCNLDVMLVARGYTGVCPRHAIDSREHMHSCRATGSYYLKCTATRREDTIDILVCDPVVRKLGVNDARSLDLPAGSILVPTTSSQLTPSFRRRVASMDVEIITVDFLQVARSRCVGTSPHRVVRDPGMDVAALPRMRADDAMVTWIGATTGDVVCVQRTASGSTHPFYRAVL